VDEVPFGPARKVLGFSFIVWYCPKSEVLKYWLLPVSIRVRQADNSYYFSLPLQVWFDMSGRGSRVYFKSQSQAVFARRSPWRWCGLSSPGEISGLGTEISSSSQINDLNKSCSNMPGEGISWLDPSRARASAASLSHQRIWWSSKSSNLFSNFLISYLYAAMLESRQLDSPMT
jgi:hypothetical protein